MIKLNLNKKIKKKLENLGLNLKANKKFRLEKANFELPCQVLAEDFFYPLKVGVYSYTGDNFRYYCELKVGRFCSIANDVSIGLHNHPTDRISTSPYFYIKDWQNNWNKGVKLSDFNDISKPVTIGDDVWIGEAVKIKSGVNIGTGAIIATGAVVTKDIPDFEIWGGVPAKKIGERKVKEFFADKYTPWRVFTEKDFLKFIPFFKRKLKVNFTQESINQAVKTFEKAKTQEEGLDKMFDELEKEQPTK